MLFVFQVDTGRMMTFDMSLALESVENLKSHVELAFKIPVDKQVLLISGGEHLRPDDRVCSYPAGTDTNPIFLFSKAVIESDQPPQASVDYGSDQDLSAKVKEHSELPATYTTVQRRAQLARLFCELSQGQMGTCEKLVHEQHLQQQGWSAVVANLEDLNADLKVRWQLYQEAFNEYIAKRDSYLEFLNHFKHDLLILQKIPVLPALLESQKLIVPEQDDFSVDKQSDSVKNEMTLLEWISQRDDFMDCLFDICSKGLVQTDEQEFLSLREEVETKLAMTDDNAMKEIKGLGDRLFGLEKLMQDARRYVSEQMKLAESFQRLFQNQSRASQIKEASVLPDLCATHLQQLNVLLENHNRLRDITRRCILAKDELSSNLYHRLKWIVFMEDNLSELDNKLVFHFRNLLSLQRQLEILQQVHTAPTTYLSSIVEVVRRRKVSQAFLLWASDVACHLLTIYNDEIARRKDFQAQIDGHFLSSLFPGMDDYPPSFATQAPSIFDSALPKLTEDDVERLKRELPELAECLRIPDTSAVTNYFMLKDAKDDIDKNVNKTVEDKLIEVVTEAGLASNLDQNILKAIENEPPQTTPHGLPHLKDLDRGCESETDTEEFEKVGQSPFDLHFDKGIPSPRPGTQDASTLTTEVGDRTTPSLPPKKPPRTFQKPHIQTTQDDSNSLMTSSSLQRNLSISSNTESFTNIKNPSLESIDELSSLKNFSSNTESCFNSHHQQMQGYSNSNINNNSTIVFRSKSISPHTPQSPKDCIIQGESPNSPIMGHQQNNDFVNDEFYIDESLPSSLSIEAGQSQGEFVKQLDTANNVVALLQDNLQISRSEYEKLRTVLIKLGQLGRQAYQQLRFELVETKNDLLREKVIVEEACANLKTNLNNLIVEKENREREVIQRLTVDHELEISDFRKIAMNKNEEIKENLELRQKLDKLAEDSTRDLEEMKQRIDEIAFDKEKSIKEVTERLKSEHKSELENIRARFKLMTMERSPSENSLEKIERGDYPSITSHETLLMQMTENFETEKEMAVNEAISKESEKWQKILEDRTKQMECDFQQEKNFLIQDIQSRIQQDQEKQITQLRDQMTNLNLECMKYKNTIQQLTEYKEESGDSELMKRVETLEKEKIALMEELEKYKNVESTTGMAASVAVCEGTATTDAATSPVKLRKRSEISSSPRSGKLNIDSCKPGDLVLVVWDIAHQNFKILQESVSLYFLNAECLESLGLKIVEGQPNKLYCYAEVVEKEYCHARKPVNRFRVPQGTKFFRVKVKPPPSAKEIPTQHQHQQQPPVAALPERSGSHMSQSQTTVSQVSDVVATTAGPSHSLPSSPSKSHWEKSESQESAIPEEKGEDLTVAQGGESSGRNDEDIEKGTELTENFNVDNQSSIDR